MRLRNTPTLAVALGLVVSCGPEKYIYAPEGAITSAEGRLVARIAIPPEKPRGEVRLESFGVTRLDAGSDRQIDAIHLRMTVGNDADDRPWTVDTREQLIEIPKEGRSRPIFANSDRDSLPSVEIGRRDQRVIDLFYPLPANMKPEQLTRFDLLWEVNTGDRTVAQRTPFGRVSEEPDLAYSASLGVGWGPYWWYDPFYPDFVFIHSRPIVVQNPTRVIVTQPPHGRFVPRTRRG